ncbi:hypothetical protein BJV78DRAFT_353723 [Lactifluus subvellereus]|nr:hypothetical protein BJV78DRAFT_353723 [Lactifluus subvellereus]
MPSHNVAMDPVVPPLAADLVETFFFGVYSSLFAFSTFFMLRKGLSNRTRNVMLVVSVVIWLRVGKIFITPSEAVVLIYVPFVNYILSDCIVLWRAWVLWNRRFILFIPPLIFMLSTLAISVASAVFAYEGSETNSVRKTDISYTLRWCAWGLSISTNAWATCLIFILAWEYRRFLRSQFGKENATSKAESALAFLVESGALYLCIWLTFITITAVAPHVVAFFRISFVQIVGIYPTAIFVVVTMRMSATDILSHPGRDTRHHPSTMIYAPSSPTAQPSILVMTAGSSSDSGFFLESRENRPTRILASSDPEKGGKIGYVA